MNKTRWASRISTALVLLVIAGCGGEGGASTPAPIPTTGVDASADVSADVAADAPPEGQAEADVVITPKRLVVTRNPLGNVSHTANLLLDGDFEWLGGYASQYPWLMFGPSTVTFEPPASLVGYKCHSGMRCASLGVADAVAGIGLRAQAQYLKVSAWTRPPIGDCTQATVSVGSCFYVSQQPVVDAVSSAPDADGWCHHEAIVDAPANTPCVFVSNDLFEDTMLLDDVVMEASEVAQGGQRAARQPGARHLAAVGRLREGVREFFKPKPPVWARPSAPDAE